MYGVKGIAEISEGSAVNTLSAAVKPYGYKCKHRDTLLHYFQGPAEKLYFKV